MLIPFFDISMLYVEDDAETRKNVSRMLERVVSKIYLASNGQIIETGSFVTAAIAQGATSGTLNVAVNVPGSITAIPSASTILFTMYPEVLVKINFGIHEYYTATAV